MCNAIISTDTDTEWDETLLWSNVPLFKSAVLTAHWDGMRESERERERKMKKKLLEERHCALHIFRIKPE